MATETLPGSALDHPRRQAIYEAVRREPGMNWNQLQRRTGLSVGSLMFHLQRLEQEDQLLRRESTNENEVLFFTPENVDLWRDPRTRLLFGNESTRRIAEVLTAQPGITAKEIAEHIGVTPAAIRYHLTKLDDRDLLERERQGRSVHYRPSSTLADWVQRWE
ncbi:MAG: winged helix-turn-helix transcriptional regulator [Candidatus Thermoplasmatota archaeon]|nr:winged helix-turn-helix transcriptional regulator [Candidatus Thermoplasmatota archaeon]